MIVVQGDDSSDLLRLIGHHSHEFIPSGAWFGMNQIGSRDEHLSGTTSIRRWHQRQSDAYSSQRTSIGLRRSGSGSAAASASTMPRSAGDKGRQAWIETS